MNETGGPLSIEQDVSMSAVMNSSHLKILNAIICISECAKEQEELDESLVTLLEQILSK
jgi:hypothetical protein